MPNLAPLFISHECYVSNLINFFSLNSFNLQFLEFFETPDFLKFFTNDPDATYRIDIEHEMMMIRSCCCCLVEKDVDN